MASVEIHRACLPRIPCDPQAQLDRHVDESTTEIVLGGTATDGCRDDATEEAFVAVGVHAFTFWCAVLTLKRRERAPSGASEKIFLINTKYVPIPRSPRTRGIRVDHHVGNSFSPTRKRAMAESLLKTNRDEACLGITTKIHWALPCAAMGIPTVFIGNAANPRLRPVGQVLPINDFSHRRSSVVRRLQRSALNRRFIARAGWDPPAPDFEEQKLLLTQLFQTNLQSAMSRRGLS